ncbi:MAG TPA: NAD(P)-binding domain-containing protein [Coriobacteriia bacterium]|nr:NAD(P)-binding domain-containing protein [Coriobacteriia bacterium]
MRIGIVGSGKIGATAARLFVGAGHEVAVSNSRGPDSLGDLTAELGDGARAATVEDAARFGELVLVAIPAKADTELPADAFEGDVVIDAMNYYPQRDGQISELDRGEATDVGRPVSLRANLQAREQPGWLGYSAVFWPGWVERRRG